MVEEEIGIVVDVLPMCCQPHLRVVAEVPFLVDLHVGNIVPSDSAPQVHCHSEEFVLVVGARQGQHLGVFYVVCQFDQTVVFISKSFQVELSTEIYTSRMLGDTEIFSILSAS